MELYLLSIGAEALEDGSVVSVDPCTLAQHSQVIYCILSTVKQHHN